MEQWQPIDTAPMDGTRVLIYEQPTGKIYAAWWDATFEWVATEAGSDEGEPDGHYRGAWTDDAVLSFAYEETKSYEPTHWMRLPSPPVI